MQAREWERELRILNAVAEALNSAGDIRQALVRTLSLVTELLHLQTGWVWLIDPETGQFYSAAAQNLPPFLTQPVRMAGRPTCWCIESFRAGKLTPENIDVMECSRLRAAIAETRDADSETRGLRYHASIPLTFRDRPLGIMNVTGPSWRRLTPEELRLLSTIAYQVGIAVERARLAGESLRLARAEERTRIAREIHDTLAQSLTAIALHIEGALPHLGQNPDRARERLLRALALARTSLEEARRSVLGLRGGANGDNKPLVEALAALARAFTAESGVRAHLRVLGPENASLPPRIEAELFRIAQEALANVRRHAAGAAEVAITLQIRAGTIRLTLRDDGQGFDAAGVASPASHGIVGMRERAKLLNGTLRIRSGPGRGTTVTASVPLPQQETPS